MLPVSKTRGKPSPANRFHTLGCACQALFGNESMGATTLWRNCITGNDCAWLSNCQSRRRLYSAKAVGGSANPANGHCAGPRLSEKRGIEWRGYCQACE
jgi:hypothetical protein